MAVDHVRKFVEDELIIEPKAFLRLGALGKIYHDWVEFHGVINRRVSANELLLRLERDYGLTPGTIYINLGREDEGSIYGLRGARLRDPALNAKRRTGKGYFARPARTWEGVIAGVIPDVAQRIAARDESADDEEDGCGD
jgi:hypothetical protein